MEPRVAQAKPARASGRPRLFSDRVWVANGFPGSSMKRPMSLSGHVPTFASPLRNVWNAAMTGHSGANVVHAVHVGNVPEAEVRLVAIMFAHLPRRGHSSSSNSTLASIKSESLAG